MDEKTIQDLLATFPDDLIEPGLVLLKREGYIGSAYYDLLYKTKYGDLLLVEVKADSIKGRKAREVTGQILEYYFKLKETSQDTAIWMMVIAPEISEETKKLFEKNEIDYKEISFRQFHRVANHHNYSIPNNTETINFIENQSLFSDESTFSHKKSNNKILNKNNEPIKLHAYRIKGTPNKRPIQVTKIISKQEILEYIKHVTKQDIKPEMITEEIINQFSARKQELVQGRLEKIPEDIKNLNSHIKTLHDWTIKASSKPKSEVTEDAVNCMMQCFGKNGGYRYRIEIID